MDGPLTLLTDQNIESEATQNREATSWQHTKNPENIGQHHTSWFSSLVYIVIGEQGVFTRIHIPQRVGVSRWLFFTKGFLWFFFP